MKPDIHPDYVALLASASQSVTTVPQVVNAVVRGLADPVAGSSSRRAVASELFYRPGTATSRCIAQLYDAIELPPSAALAVGQEDACRLSV